MLVFFTRICDGKDNRLQNLFTANSTGHCKKSSIKKLRNEIWQRQCLRFNVRKSEICTIWVISSRDNFAENGALKLDM